MSAMPNDIILISNYAHHDMKSLLEKQKATLTHEEKSTFQEQLEAYGALFQHEIGHLKNNDSKKTLFYTMGALATTLAISKLFSQFLFKNPLVTIKENIIWGIFIGFCNLVLLNQKNKFQEQRADNSIPNNFKILQSFKKFLIGLDNREKKDILTIGKNNSPFIAQLKRKILVIIVNFLESHPTYEARIQQIDKRLGQISSTEK